MKIKNIMLVLVVLIFGTLQYVVASTPVVSNVAFSISGTTVTVTYDVSDTGWDFFTVYMEVSDDGGTTWDYDYGATTGDIGANVAEGNNKTITWQYSGGVANNFKIKILADNLDGDQIYYERQIYNTVVIGPFTWLKENLNVGTMLPNAATKGTDNGTIEKHCYNDLETNCDTYGGLYSWNELMQYATADSSQGICPAGWRVPDLDDWHTINDATTSLTEIMVDGTNTTGFSAIRGAYMWSDVYYSESSINIASSHQNVGNSGYSVYFQESSAAFGEYANPDHPEYAVRCVKD